MSQISIIGCGWLGFPLAKRLISSGYSVKGSTTSASKIQMLSEHDIQPFLISLTESSISNSIEEFLEGSTTLIINIPPGLRKNPNKNHVEEMQLLFNKVLESAIENILFIGSISVFKDDENFPVIENDSIPNGTTTGAIQLIEVEKRLSILSKNYTILRLAGLFDETRHPGNTLSGRSDLKNGKAPLNLIHKQDVIAAVVKILDLGHWNAVMNLSYPFHPPKQEFYKQYALKTERPTPEYNPNIPSKGKRINSEKTEHVLGINLSHKP